MCPRAGNQAQIKHYRGDTILQALRPSQAKRPFSNALLIQKGGIGGCVEACESIETAPPANRAYPLPRQGRRDQPPGRVGGNLLVGGWDIPLEVG